MKLFLDKKWVANGKSWLAIHGAVALFIMVIVVPQASAQDTKVQSLESALKLMESQLQALRSELDQVKSASTSGSHKITAAASTSAMSDKSPPKERHDWTGFYVGGFVGGGSGAGVRAIDLGDDPDPSLTYHTNASAMGGGTVGYNWQLGGSPWLAGLEAEYGYLSLQGSTPVPNNPAPGSIEDTFSANIGGAYGYGVIGGRMGYTLERSLFYIKSGAVFTSTQTNEELSCPGCPVGGLTSASAYASGKSNDVGYAIGGGIEQALPPEWFKLAKNVSIKAEYLYLGIGRTQTESGNLVVNGTTTFDNWTADRISGIHTAKIGINYRFRGF